jgi:uncharacterized protein (DUF924 family)
MQESREVLDFWFAPGMSGRWFEPTPELDMTVRRRFGELYARAATDQLKDWEHSSGGCLALCILLDQMARMIFRGDARAFATDHKALAIADHAVAHGFDRRLPQEQRQFLYLPFMHSENLADQLRCLALFEATRLTTARRHAKEHLEIIRRFGRFPHRNRTLGRESTRDELAYLQTSRETYGQGARPPTVPALPPPAGGAEVSNGRPKSGRA